MAKLLINGLFPAQKALINDIFKSDKKFHIINASRQSSKTFSISKLVIMFAMTTNDNILVTSPSYEQARLVYDNIINTVNIDTLLLKKKSSKPYELLFQTGARVSFKSAERYDNIRGGSYLYVICDEFAFFKQDVFDTVIRPTTAAKKNSKIVIASTPKGIDNDFHKMVELCDINDNYVYYFLHYSQNPYYDLDEVKDAKLRLPSPIFRQEYEGEFIEDSGDVFEFLDDITVLNNWQNVKQNEQYFAGIDWGRADDKTVLTILNSKRETVFIQSWNKITWDTIINNISIPLKLYRPITYAESNGIGDPLISQLMKSYSNLKPFTMSNTSKREIVELLKMNIYKKDIKIANSTLCPELKKELSSFTFSQTKTGLLSYHHSPNGHDDYVDSLCLANYAFEKHNLKLKASLPSNNSIYNLKSNSIYA